MQRLSASKLVILLLLCLQTLTLASNVEYGTPASAQVVAVKKSAEGPNYRDLTVKLLDGCKGSGLSWHKAGTTVQFTVFDKNSTFAAGQKIKVRWMRYSAMSPNGPVSGTSWGLVP